MHLHSTVLLLALPVLQLACASEYTDALQSGAGPQQGYQPTSAQPAYDFLKASNASTFAEFGTVVQISADGNTLAVGAPGESSKAAGVNGQQTDESASRSGAVYVFARENGKWAQQAYLKASNAQQNDRFGASISLSADGSSLVVGAPNESSGFRDDQLDNSAEKSGAAYVFSRSNETWKQRAYLKSPRANAGLRFGATVSISGDGKTVAATAPCQTSTTAPMECEAMTSRFNPGAVYVFRQQDGVWEAEDAELKSLFPQIGFAQGEQSLSLSDDGNLLLVSSKSMDASVGAAANGSHCAIAGAVWVFTRGPIGWGYDTQLIRRDTSVRCGIFGTAVGISSDGKRLAVVESQLFLDSGKSAYVHLYKRNDSTWAPEGLIEVGNRGDVAGREFGSLAWSADGMTLAVGDTKWAERAEDLNDVTRGKQSTGGTVFVYTRGGLDWALKQTLHLGAPEQDALFGRSLSLSADGSSIAVGAPHEASRSKGAEAYESSAGGADKSGASYVFAL